MKKYILIVLIALSFFNVLLATDFYVTGTNEANFIYKNAEDSLKTYFDNKMCFQAGYKNFRFGMRFTAELPKYDKYHAMKDLQNKEITYNWEDRFVELELGKFFARAGNFEASFGNGLVLNAQEDNDLDIDTRLEGLFTKFSNDYFTIKALYGGLNLDEINPSKTNTVGGVDIEYYLHDFITVGASGAVFNNFSGNFGGKDVYVEQDVFAPRTTITYDMITINTEVAFSHNYGTQHKDIKGKAIFSDMDLYLGNFSIYSAYKNYDKFDYPDFKIGEKYYAIHDLPTANHSDEPLDENVTPGFDEEGILGEVKYTTPVNMHEFVVNYSESWSDNYKKQQSDLYSAATLNFDEMIVKFELESIETINDEAMVWKRETTPKLSIDMPFFENPMHIKAEYGHEKKQHFEVESYHYEPLLQCDYTIGDYSFSVIAEHEFKTSDDLFDGDFWVGAELTAGIYEHTNLSLFVGKEKGGKICRNGSCKYQTPFEGVRLNILTNF